LALVFAVLSLTAHANAQVIFSEVMYDAPGGDTDHEWIEIQNTGVDAVDVSKYRLTEGATNHTLATFQGTSTIPAGSFAIIVKNPAAFLADHPNFAGIIFDSTFSLSNTGETLVLKDSKLSVVDSFTYSSSLGANGNGETLQKIGGSWTIGNPTPGVVNVYTPAPAKAEAPLPAPKKTTSKGSTSTTASKKLSATKIAQVLNTPAENPKTSSATVDLSTLDQGGSQNDAWKWYVGLGALMLVAIGGVFALRFNAAKPKSEYEIIE
jgi:hypothetical protein